MICLSEAASVATRPFRALAHTHANARDANIIVRAGVPVVAGRPV